MKKQTVSSLKKLVWKDFSKYIRLRDCLETTGTLTRGKCVTCQKTFPIEDLQAGHFIAGRCGENLFDERGCYAQCRQCNIFNHGALEDYYPFMLKRWGEEVIEELKVEKRTPKRWTIHELEIEREAIKQSTDYILEMFGKEKA